MVSVLAEVHGYTGNGGDSWLKAERIRYDMLRNEELLGGILLGNLRVANEPEEEIKSQLQYLSKRILLISEKEHIHNLTENLKC